MVCKKPQWSQKKAELSQSQSLGVGDCVGVVRRSSSEGAHSQAQGQRGTTRAAWETSDGIETTGVHTEDSEEEEDV